MKRYETLFITDPDLPDEDRKAVVERFAGIVEGEQGYCVRFDEWGPRKLAYEVKKRKRGFYILADYCATGTVVKELERTMRIDERVLRYLTVKLADNVDIEQLKIKLAEEAAAKAKAEDEAEREKARKEAERIKAIEEARAEAARDDDESDQDDESGDSDADSDETD
ncbi:MAG: 30S ribosomal protein S6 [Desulfatibacillaceae bacterium]|nr:30S ribosomal protein S6 [Desulfatibacillaceae bacterium]